MHRLTTGTSEEKQIPGANYWLGPQPLAGSVPVFVENESNLEAVASAQAHVTNWWVMERMQLILVHRVEHRGRDRKEAGRHPSADPG